jgi:hypothetical protein
MYVLACVPIYGDCGRDFCCNPAGSQESAPELGVGYEFAIKDAPLRGSLNTCRLKVTNLDDGASRRSLAGSWIELET